MPGGGRNTSYWSQILSSKSYVFPGQTKVERMFLGEEITYGKSVNTKLMQGTCRKAVMFLIKYKIFLSL